MNNSGTHKAASFFRWTARIIGAPVTLVLFSLFTVTNMEIVFRRFPHPMPGMPSYLPLTAHAVLNIVFGLIVLAAYLVSWWKERLGGFLLILTSFLVLVPEIVLLIENSHAYQVSDSLFSLSHLNGWGMMWAWAWTGGLPLLVIGIFFLIASWLSRKKAIPARAESAVAAES